jgi:hypothetical protein
MTTLLLPTASLDYAVPRHDELPDTFPKGRRCFFADEGCRTRLSIYNPGPACFQHTPAFRRIVLARDGED